MCYYNPKYDLLHIDDNREIRATNNGVNFKRRQGKRFRSLYIPFEAFNKMEDITKLPVRCLELSPNIALVNLGDRIHLVKYCTSRDGKRCNAGLFMFSMDDWQAFWRGYFPFYEGCCPS